MADGTPVRYRWHGGDPNDGHINGIPARNLTQADLDGMSDNQRAAVVSQRALYKPTSAQRRREREDETLTSIVAEHVARGTDSETIEDDGEDVEPLITAGNVLPDSQPTNSAATEPAPERPAPDQTPAPEPTHRRPRATNDKE
jgi:hypothetical protein